MKKMQFILFAVAAIAAASCVKEEQKEVSPNVNLIPMSFTVGSEGTKVQLQDDKSIHWEVTDKIKVYDGISTELEPFETTESGSKVVFNGNVSNGSTEHYAVYPHSAAKGFDATNKTLSITLPETQTASAGNVPSNAFISVAKADDEKNLAFKNVTAFVKFSLSDATDIKSVTISGNAGESLTGDMLVSIGENGIPSNAPTANMNYTATLSGTFESQKDYYIAIRSAAFSKGITLSIYKNNGTQSSRAYISSKDAPSTTITRNTIFDLKELNVDQFKSTAPADQFLAYLHGYNVEIGDYKLHKTSGIKPKLVTATSANQLFRNEIHNKTNDILLFLNQEENCSFKIDAATDIKGDIKIIGRKNTSKVCINFSAAFQTYSGSLMFKNVDIQMSHTSYITTHLSSATDNLSHYYFDNCTVSDLQSSLIYCNNATYGIKNIYVCNCDIEIDKDAQTLFNGSRNTTNFTLKNNVIYNTSLNGVQLSIFANGQNGDVTNIVITNNTIGNCHPVANGYIFINGCETVNITNNLFHIPGYTQYKSILRTKTADYPKSGVIKTNVSYSPNNTLKACHNTPTSNEVTQESVSRNNDNTMLTLDSDISKGIYKSTNSTYGAKR